MIDTTPNQSLYRLYAIACLIGAAMVIAVAFAVSDLPALGIAIYLGIGVALWCLDLVVTGVVWQREHGLARLVLLAGFALVWPLAVAALVAFLGAATFKALR